MAKIKTTVIPQKRQVIYDTYANFPTAGLEKGDMAWATDRKCLYRWSSSAWQTMGISSRHGDVADIGDPAHYPESSLYQADDEGLLYMVISGAWEQITVEAGLPPFQVGNELVIVANTEQPTTETTYTKMKEILLASSGIVRVCFDLRIANALKIASGRIYKNGEAHGTERNTSEITYQTYSEDLEFSTNDLLQLYTKTSSGTYTAYCKNLQLKANRVHLHQVNLD